MTELTGKTVTDAMIRTLRDDAEREGHPDLVQTCESALRFPTTIRTFADAKERLAARTACAQEIRRRAHGWRESGDAQPIAWARYAELVEALPAPDASGTTTEGNSSSGGEVCQ